MEYKILIENQLISKELNNINKFLDFNQMLIDNGYTINEYYVFDLMNNLVSKVFIKNIKEPKFISIDKSLRTPKFHNEESLRITNELFNLGSVPQQFTRFNNQSMNNQLVYDDLYKSVQPKQYTDYITELTKELTNNGLRNKLFLNWLIKDYKAGNCLVEDLFVKGIPCIIDFNNDNIKNILSEKGYSLRLTDYKVNELYGIIENIKATEIIDDTDLLNKRMICRSGNWVCVSPLNYEESVSLSRYGGTITSWCTAVEGNDTYFNRYTGIEKYNEMKFPLFIFLNLKDPTEKYQANLYIEDSIEDNFENYEDYLDEKYLLQFMDIKDNSVIPGYGNNKLKVPETILEMIQIPEIKKYLYSQNSVSKGLYTLDSEFLKLTNDGVYEEQFSVNIIADSDLSNIKGFKKLSISTNKYGDDPKDKITKFSDEVFVEMFEMNINKFTTKNIELPKTLLFDDSKVKPDEDSFENKFNVGFFVNDTLINTTFKIPDIKVNTELESDLYIILKCGKTNSLSKSDNVKFVLPKIESNKGLNSVTIRIDENIGCDLDVSNFYESYLNLIKQNVKIILDCNQNFLNSLNKYLIDNKIDNSIIKVYQIWIDRSTILDSDTSNFKLEAEQIYIDDSLINAKSFLIGKSIISIKNSKVVELTISNETGVFEKITIEKNDDFKNRTKIINENIHTINTIHLNDLETYDYVVDEDNDAYTPSLNINVRKINVLSLNTNHNFDKLKLNMGLFNVFDIGRLAININSKDEKIDFIENYQNISKIQVNGMQYGI